MDQRNFIASWESIHTIIDEALEKRDRSVSIYVSPDGGLSVSVHPWPDDEKKKEGGCHDGVCEINL